MDIEKIDPAVLIAIIGVVSTIIGGLIGSRVRDAQAEDTEASAADKLSVGYTRLVDSWENRLEIVQADLIQMRKESAEDRRELKRLALAEAELKTKLSVVETELVVVRVERDALKAENEALWARIEELEEELERRWGQSNGIEIDGVVD